MKVTDLTLPADPQLLKDLSFQFFGVRLRLRIFPDYVNCLLELGPFAFFGLYDYEK